MADCSGPAYNLQIGTSSPMRQRNVADFPTKLAAMGHSLPRYRFLRDHPAKTELYA